MNYLTRYAERKIKAFADHFRAVLVTGARQVGKSTLLRYAFPNLKSIVFDPYLDLYGARKDPDFFLDNFPPPIILDEIQYVPELISAIKRRTDEQPFAGQYLLSGSQNLSVLKTITESMAGRVGILHLEAMSLDELCGQGDRCGWLSRYLADPGSIKSISASKEMPGGLLRTIWRGGMPGIIDLPDDMVPAYLKSYVETYIERDVRLLANIRDLDTFGRFLGLCAALTAQEVNHSQLGREVGVQYKTAGEWLGMLKHTYQWKESSPYFGNTIKRLSRRSKGYLSDTGLVCYLQRITSPHALAVSPLLGPLFETWVYNEIAKQSMCLPISPLLYHWRTNGGAEVDIILEIDGKYFPIEVKCAAAVSRHDARGMRAFRDTYVGKIKIMDGLVIYAGKDIYGIDENVTAIPWNMLTAVS